VTPAQPKFPPSSQAGLKTIRVVIADDSATIRNLLARLFAPSETAQPNNLPLVELCAAAPDGQTCLRAVRALQPDLVILDLEMPGLSGMETIDLLRREWPDLPIIMFSAYTARGASQTLEALARGATDYVTKPTGQPNPEAAIAALREDLLPKIIVLATRRHTSKTPPATRVTLTAPTVPAQVVGIGVSTGGPSALELLLPHLPHDFPAPVLIVQHMPRLFTNALALRLDRACALAVNLAYDGAEPTPGTIWLAPGDSHMELAITNGRMRIALNQDPPELHCRPSVNPLFRSLARTHGSRALGVIMTGMGSDGLDGSHALVHAGGAVLAQDEPSSTIWGMPGRVVAAGLASAVLPIAALAEAIIQRSSRNRNPHRVLPIPLATERHHGSL